MTTACLIHIPPLPMMLIFTMKKQVGKSQIQPPKALQFHDPKRTVKKVTISPTLQFHEFSEHSTKLTQIPNAIKEDPAKNQESLFRNKNSIQELNVKKLSFPGSLEIKNIRTSEFL